MKHNLFKFFILICFCAFIFGCVKQTEQLTLPTAEVYYPLKTGSVIKYRLDSSLIPYSGSVLTVRSYHAKDSIADTIRDNENRLSYRVYRFISDTLEKTGWVSDITYYVTPGDKKIEVMDEHNLRFIKIAEPIRDGYNWKGNSYIDTKSANSPYQYMDEWNYTYQNYGAPFQTVNGTFPNTITVLQQDETSPPGPFDPANYQQRNYAIEVYAAGVGLIYKEFLHWTWQTTPVPKFDNDSYGIKLSLIDYY